MTFALGFLVATVSLAGYALANKQAKVVLLATTVPLLGFALDLLVVYRVAVPFLYKLLSSHSQNDESEPLLLLFLEFGTSSSKFRTVWGMEPGPARQRKFRSAYVRAGMVRRTALFGFASLGIIGLWTIARLS